MLLCPLALDLVSLFSGDDGCDAGCGNGGRDSAGSVSDASVLIDGGMRCGGRRCGGVCSRLRASRSRLLAGAEYAHDDDDGGRASPSNAA